MKYTFATAALETDTGTPMLTSETDSAPYTADKAFARGLLADTNDNTKTKLERYELFLRVRANEDEYSAKEVALLREAALVYPTLIAGQLVKILDQK